VIGGVEVVGGLHHHDALVVQLVDDLAHEGGVPEVGGHRDDDPGALVGGELPGLGQVVRGVERLVAGLDRQDGAVGTLVVDDVHLVVGVVVGRVHGGRVVLVVVEVPA